MQFNLFTIAALFGTATALAMGDRPETNAGLDKRGCRFIDKNDCNERYWACQQDSLPSAINWYALSTSSSTHAQMHLLKLLGLQLAPSAPAIELGL